MTATTVPADTIPLPDRRSAAEGAGQELAALIAMTRQFTPAQWAARTECPAWTARDMVAHLAGALEEAIRPTVMIRHQVLAARGVRRDRGTRDWVDYTTEAQVAERAGRDPEHLVAELVAGSARLAAARAWVPEPIRRLRAPAAGGLRPGADLAYLFDVIYARDVWLHRVDLMRATGVAMPESAAEPMVVEQVVRDLDLEWTGPAFDLEVTGRVHGSWRVGRGEPVARVREDAVALMRLLSGRSDECRFEVSGDPAAAGRLRAARVVF